jgi:light-regulated signal transduction histidine kinase (bacteriophytochrome)
VQELYGKPEAESFDILEFKDGKIFERYSQPQRLGEKIVGRVWSFRDVTDQKIAQQEIEKKTNELARSNQELEQFAYIASHDLQEPLHKIVAFSDLIQELFKGELNEKLLDYIQRMQNAAGRMRGLIDDLLQFACITTQANPFEEIDLNQLMHEVLIDLEQRIVESKGEIRIGKLPKIYADARQMQQLFLNLLSNALKFSKKNEIPKVEMMGESEGEKGVNIKVIDNGIGFDEKYLNKAFQPFQRLHVGREYEGSGMGLTLCQKIVERHGGKITVKSKVGKGTEFLVYLPIHPQER